MLSDQRMWTQYFPWSLDEGRVRHDCWGCMGCDEMSHPKEQSREDGVQSQWGNPVIINKRIAS